MIQMLQTATENFWLITLTFLSAYTWYHMTKAQKKAAIRLEKSEL